MNAIPDENWEAYRDQLVQRCRPECVAVADRFVAICRAAGRHPSVVLGNWAYWHEVFDRGRMIPPGWPDALTAGDWKSLTMFAENETRATAAGVVK